VAGCVRRHRDLMNGLTTGCALGPPAVGGGRRTVFSRLVVFVLD